MSSSACSSGETIIPKLPCGICAKTIAINHRHILCKICNAKVHIKCNKTDVKTYLKIVNENLSQICIKCRSEGSENLPNNQLLATSSGETNLPKLPCGICAKTIAKNHRHILCKICNTKVHIKCNKTDVKTYLKIYKEKLPQTCIKCQSEGSEHLPFQQLSDTQFSAENNCIFDTAITKTKTKVDCGVCKKNIAKNHRNIKCKSCNMQVHIKCNNTNVKTFNKIIKENLPQFCKNCQPADDTTQISKISCGVCTKTIAKNHRRIQCNLCNSSVHIKCNKTDPKTYNDIIKEKQMVICLNCQINNIPFQNLSELEFSAAIKCIDTDTEILEKVLVTSTSLNNFFKEINKSNPFDHPDNIKEEDDDAILLNCKYVDLSSFDYKPSRKNFSLFHTNIGSLAKHKDELQTTLTMLEYKFDIIVISETKLSKNSKPSFDINLGYKCYPVDTESAKGGSFIYVSGTLNQNKDQIWNHCYTNLSYLSLLLSR